MPTTRPLRPEIVGFCCLRRVMVTVIDLSEWVSTGEAARRIGKSRERIIQMVTRGQLSYVMTPLGRLVKLNEVEEIVKRRAEALVKT